MIERKTDAVFINKIVNDESVYPWVHGAMVGPLDLTDVVADRNNVALFGEHGGIIFILHQDGYYEAHTQVLPAGRGAWSVEMVRHALHWMFTRTGAVEIVTRVPKGNYAARALTKIIGGTYEFTNAEGWIRDFELIPADIFSLTVQDWIKNAPGLVEIGRWFLNKFSDECAALGKARNVHIEDAFHCRQLGAAISMIAVGQPWKATILFNRYAAVASRPFIAIENESEPVMVKVEDTTLVFRNENFWVAQCQ